VGGLKDLCATRATNYTARLKASWQSGHAQDCKSCYPGSTPGEASKPQRLGRYRVSEVSDHPLFPRHGGELGFATALYGTPAGGWLDLSTGVNPHAYPVVEADLASATGLPSRDALEALIRAARDAYRVPAEVALIATPGTEIAIRLLPIMAPSGPVAIVSPTYRSHIDAWVNAGRATTLVPTLSSPAALRAQVLVLGNPNNPDGSITPPAALAEVAARLARRNGLLVVDEAFADLSPELSLVTHLASLTAVVLRSFGKFFGLPGLRLGFVIGEAALLGRLEALLGDWPISAPAIAIGTRALSDEAWQAAMRERLSGDAARLRALFASQDIEVGGGADLFLLIDDAEAPALHRRLAKEGIWTRLFEEEPTWLRVGIPGSEVDFTRLADALDSG
jgi:cobalamin biosynthetic protein CobC